MSNRPTNFTRSSIYYEGECDVHCTDTDKTVNGHITSFKPELYLIVTLESKVIMNLQYNKQHDVYIGSMAGLEFQSNGPKRIA